MRAAVPFGVVLLLAGLVAAPARTAEEGESYTFMRPSLRVGFEATDNARLDRGQENDDYAVRVRPRLELGYQSHLLDALADLEVDVRQHAKEGRLDEVFYRLRGRAEAGLLPGLTLVLRDDYVPNPVALGAPEDHDGNLVQTNRAAAKLRYWRAIGERFELRVEGSGARFDAETITTAVPGPGGTAVPGNFRANHWEGGGSVQLGRRLGERGVLFVRSEGHHRAYDDLDAASHTAVRALVGTELRPLEGLALQLEGGAGALDLDGRDAEPHFVGRADLAYRRGRWRLGAALAHGLTRDIVGNAFRSLTGRLVLERSFGSRTRATLTGFAARLDSESQASQQDAFGGAELLVRRQLSRELSLDVSYRFWENAGSRKDNDFRQHRGFLELRYAY